MVIFSLVKRINDYPPILMQYLEPQLSLAASTPVTLLCRWVGKDKRKTIINFLLPLAQRQISKNICWSVNTKRCVDGASAQVQTYNKRDWSCVDKKPTHIYIYITTFVNFILKNTEVKRPFIWLLINNSKLPYLNNFTRKYSKYL